MAGGHPREHVSVGGHDPVRILSSALVRVHERPLEVHPRDQPLVGQWPQDVQLSNNFLLIGANEAGQQGRRPVSTVEQGCPAAALLVAGRERPAITTVIMEVDKSRNDGRHTGCTPQCRRTTSRRICSLAVQWSD